MSREKTEFHQPAGILFWKFQSFEDRLLTGGKVGETAKQMPDWIQAGVARGEALTAVLSDDEKQVLAQGDEVSRTCVWEGRRWQERVLVVCSPASVHTQRQHLQERLDKAQAALRALTPPVGRGKRQITEEAAFGGAATATPPPLRLMSCSIISR